MKIIIQVMTAFFAVLSTVGFFAYSVSCDGSTASTADHALQRMACHVGAGYPASLRFPPSVESQQRERAG
jgi:hypothetical protein